MLIICILNLNQNVRIINLSFLIVKFYVRLGICCNDLVL